MNTCKKSELYNITQNDFSNIEVLHRNREESRTHFQPYGSIEKALAGKTTNNERVVSLNGSWDFEWLTSPLMVDDNKIKTDKLPFKITVPKNWQYDGFGKFHYTDMWYPFPVDPPNIPTENETGVYKKTFDVSGVKNKNTSIRFEGVESAFHLYINGKQVGYSQGSRLPSEFNISEFVVDGKNEICVVVYQYCDGTYLEDQDMLWLGGIIRDVYLIFRERSFAKNIVLDPDFDILNNEGILNVNIVSEYAKSATIQVYKENNLLSENEGIEINCISLIRVKNIDSWTAETPNIYTVLVILGSVEKPDEVIPFKIGFRNIKIKDGTLLLNGKKIFMKGINRHEYNNKTGRAVGYDQTYAELSLIKDSNMNALRTAHYPNNPYVYEICNELGIYVIDECDLETHGFELVNQRDRLCSDKKWEAAYIDRVERMVQRDRNFACVLIWSLGNESYFGDNFRSMYRWCKENEPTRPVHYQEDFDNEVVDVSSTMYSTVGQLKELDLDLDPKRPHILCEFGHAMGNGPGSLKEYLEVTENSERIQGIFLWEFSDHSVCKVRDDGKIQYLYGGDFQEKFHNKNFCLDGIVMADGTLSPAFYEYKKLLEPIQITYFNKESMSFVLKNKYDFLTLENIICQCTIIQDEKVVKTFDVPIPLILPREERIIRIEDGFEKYTTNALVRLELSFLKNFVADTKKSLVASYNHILSDYIPKSVDLEPLKRLKVTRENEYIIVSSGDVKFGISLTDGCISNYCYKSEQLIINGPQMNYYRAFTDNDIKDVPVWEAAHLHSMQTVIHKAEILQSDDLLSVVLLGKFSPQGLAWGTELQIVYNIFEDGEISVTFSGDFFGDYPRELPKIGTQMQIPLVYDKVKYCGFGNRENYCDSKESSFYGIHVQTVEEMQVAYPFPQENGNRCGVTFCVLQSEDNGVILASTNGADFSVRDVNDYQLYKCQHQCDLVKDDFITVNFDYKNSGIGSGSCGPTAMKHYRVNAKRFTHSFAIAPLVGEAVFSARRLLDLVGGTSTV